MHDFESSPSSQSIPPIHFAVFLGADCRVRDTGVQPTRKRAAGLCPKIRFALLGLPRVLADAELLWTEVQRQRLSAHE